MRIAVRPWRHEAQTPRLFVGIEQHPAIGVVENLLNEARVYRMSRALSDHMPDKGHAEQRKVSDQVQDLVTDELIGKAKA